uniref:Uncharacterized protein n=1 Tax=Globisporangium ultimum (strain ATCC 200006 / CBS 805.95 / DAOM BR144) TaxID=431595 RepID=K3X9U0_GLOUD
MLQSGEQSGYGRVGSAGSAHGPSTISTPGNSSNLFGVKPLGVSRQVSAGHLNEPRNNPGVALGVFGSETFTFTNGGAGQSTGDWYRNPQRGAVNPFQANASRGPVSAQNPFTKVVAAAPAPPANPFQPAAINDFILEFHLSLLEPTLSIRSQPR